MAGALPLLPEPPARAGVEVGKAGGTRCLQRLGIHECHHQHRTGDGVNHHGGDQPVGIEPGHERCALFAIEVVIVSHPDRGPLRWPVSATFLLHDNHTHRAKSTARRLAAWLCSRFPRNRLRRSAAGCPPGRRRQQERHGSGCRKWQGPAKVVRRMRDRVKWPWGRPF